MALKRIFYEELRKAIETRGGTMTFVRKGYRWGAWEVQLDGRCANFESNGRGFPELDRLYEPEAENPQHWSDYSTVLVPGAIDELVSRLA